MVDPLLGEADTADITRTGCFGLDGADHELRRTTTDVDHQERPVRRIQLSGGAGEREATLLGAREQFRSVAQRRFSGVEEFLPVGGVAGRRGGGHPTSSHSVMVKYFAVFPKDDQYPLDGPRVQAPGGVHPLSHPGDAHATVQRLFPVADQQAGGVGSAVDGGHHLKHLDHLEVQPFRPAWRPPIDRPDRRRRPGTRRSGRAGT